MKSKIVGSAVGLLLFFSAISYSRTFTQPQEIAEKNRSRPRALPTILDFINSVLLSDGQKVNSSAARASLTVAMTRPSALGD